LLTLMRPRLLLQWLLLLNSWLLKGVITLSTSELDTVENGRSCDEPARLLLLLLILLPWKPLRETLRVSKLDTVEGGRSGRSIPFFVAMFASPLHWFHWHLRRVPGFARGHERILVIHHDGAEVGRR
jgi:hypothetical protein